MPDRLAYAFLEASKSGILAGDDMRQKDGHRTEQQSKASMNTHDKSHVNPVQQHQESRHKKVRTGIVSVHGRDVGEMQCTGGKHV